MKVHYRTLFLSDIHLGSTGSHAKQASRLLKHVRCDTLYLVGDIVDMWRLKRKWHWPKSHNEVVRRVLKLAERGTKVVFIPGNHDNGARQFDGMEFGKVQLKLRDIHTTADGRKLLVTHGDQYDLVVKHHPVLSAFGGLAYEWLLRFNRLYNFGRASMGYKYWSLSKYLKLKVKHACTFISRFEETLIAEAKREGTDGVVCGHIHKAEHTTVDGIEYWNCGDWVESCTLVAEHHDGKMEVLDGLKLLDEIARAKRAHSAAKAEARYAKARRDDDPAYDDHDILDADDSLTGEPVEALVGELAGRGV
ncbi:MAG: UDP-2,3-diacylglucosamine diphosphatase [Planctomycetota bacterium]